MGKQWTVEQRKHFMATIKKRKETSIPLAAIPDRPAKRAPAVRLSQALCVEVKAGSQITFTIGLTRVTVRATS